MLYELLTLEHPLGEARDVPEVLEALQGEPPSRTRVLRALVRAGAPCEYAGVLVRGLARDPRRRPASLAELERTLDDVAAGVFEVSCPLTAAKFASRGVERWLDRHGRAFMILFVVAVALGALAAVIAAARMFP
jgi:hypothetical protein